MREGAEEFMYSVPQGGPAAEHRPKVLCANYSWESCNQNYMIPSPQFPHHAQNEAALHTEPGDQPLQVLASGSSPPPAVLRLSLCRFLPVHLLFHLLHRNASFPSFYQSDHISLFLESFKDSIISEEWNF